MDTKGLQIDTETFSCSICLDLLKDPVTIPCGHSYCMRCVDSHWNGRGANQSYSCPQCRHIFTQRPVLVKNTVLAILMEGLKKSEPRAAAVCPSSPSRIDVFCDLCCGRKVRAVKSCLQCLVSYCKKHLQPHYDVPALKKHKLVEPTDSLQENLCSRHDEVMKMFCRTDQQCICYLCSVDQHKDHHTVTAAAERAEKQKELQAFQQKILHRLDHKNKDMDHLQHQVTSSCRSADAAVELCDRSLKELAAVLVKRMRDVKQQVRAQQEAEEHRVKELQDKLQQEITEMKRTLSVLDTLSHTEDHIHFLHTFASVSKVSETSASVNSSQSPPPVQDIVTAAVSKLRSALQKTSLMEPPASLQKPKVTPKPNIASAGAQVAAPLQQTSSKDLLAILLPKLNQQSTTSDSQLLQPAANRPPQPESRPVAAQVTAPQQRSLEEWPALPQRNLKPKISVPSSPSPPDIKIPTQPDIKIPTQPDIKIPTQPEVKIPTQPQVKIPTQPEVKIPTQPEVKIPTRPEIKISTQPEIKIPTQLAIVPHFKSTRELREYVRDLTLDPQSLSDNLILCHENHFVEHVSYSLEYSPNPARFTHFPQVVSKQVLTGRCSWMVDVSETSNVFVAVAYKGMRRDGNSNECCFGKNANSWALEAHYTFCYFWHNGTRLSIPTKPGKIVVFLDCSAGILSFFYRVDNKVHHIHTVRTTFTKPLVAGLQVGQGSAKLCGLEFY